MREWQFLGYELRVFLHDTYEIASQIVLQSLSECGLRKCHGKTD
jgi:hypothetical protein